MTTIDWEEALFMGCYGSLINAIIQRDPSMALHTFSLTFASFYGALKVKRLVLWLRRRHADAL